MPGKRVCAHNTVHIAAIEVARKCVDGIAAFVAICSNAHMQSDALNGMRAHEGGFLLPRLRQSIAIVGFCC